MEGATVITVGPTKLMGSEGVVGARVSESDVSKIEQRSSLISSHRGTPIASESPSWIKKTHSDYRSNVPLTSSAMGDLSQGLNSSASGSVAFITGSDGKQLQRKVGKGLKNGSVLFKKLRMLQPDNCLHQAEADETKVEPDKLGMQLIRCSNTDKSEAVKHKSIVNGRRVDRRNSRVSVKAKYDPLSLKASPSFSPANGGNIFGVYGLKPDINDVTKLIDDISLNELLDGSYKCPTLGKDKGRKATNVIENTLASVRKACLVLQVRGSQSSKQTEDMDMQVDKKNPPLSSPSNVRAMTNSDGDENSLTADLSDSCDPESSVKAEAPAKTNCSSLYQPRDILEKLTLPPAKDLDSLLQDSLKPAAAVKNSDSRGKPSSHRVSLPPFPWSHNFNGHYKSNNDAVKISNRSTCQGRWVRIRSTATFIGGSTEGFVDLESLTYDDSLVPAGQLKYRLPETATSSSLYDHPRCQPGSSSAACALASVPAPAVNSPRELGAAQTLCDIASDWSKRSSNGILKWPKQPSQKAMKARKSRLSDTTEEEFLSLKSDTPLENVPRSVDYVPSLKKSKLSIGDRREDYSHVQAVIGLSSVSAPRSSRSSPNRLSRDLVAEARHYNGSYSKPSFIIPPPPRVVDRSNSHNPPKLRKVMPMDWNRSRS